MFRQRPLTIVHLLDLLRRKLTANHSDEMWSDKGKGKQHHCYARMQYLLHTRKSNTGFNITTPRVQIQLNFYQHLVFSTLALLETIKSQMIFSGKEPPIIVLTYHVHICTCIYNSVQQLCIPSCAFIELGRQLSQHSYVIIVSVCTTKL